MKLIGTRIQLAANGRLSITNEQGAIIQEWLLTKGWKIEVMEE